MSPSSASARLRRTWPALAALLAVVTVLALAASTVGRSPGTDPALEDSATAAPPVQAPGDERPNIVLFSTDDQRLDEMVFLPKVRRLLGEQGLTFTEAITPHPLCCPARAELMTGQLAQNNGVRTNFPPQGGYAAFDNASTIGTDLTAAGYNTAFLGKMLNGYHVDYGRDPGWTLFNATSHGYADYYKFVQYDNDRIARVPGYYTDYLSDEAVEYAERLSDYDAPFFLWVSHFAPHPSKGREGCDEPSCRSGPPKMSPGYRAMARLAGRTPHEVDAQAMARRLLSSPAHNERDVSDKPALVRKQPQTSPRKVARLVRSRAASLASVDDAFARLVEQLREDGELDNTYIVFVTDNGYQLGEHRWFGKTLPYEENLRTPMLVAGPGVPAGATTDSIATIVDLVPTFLDIAGASTDRVLDGTSLLPTWRGETDEPLHPGGVLVQGGPYKPETGTRGWLYRGVRTARYTFARYHDGFVELYDRGRDPRQLTNLADQPRYAAVRAELARRTRILQDCSGERACNRRFGPLPQPGWPRRR